MSSARSTKVLILTIGNGINVLINFLTLPYLVRTLSYLNYGSYGQVLMILGLIQGVFTFNLNQVANIYFSDRNYESKEVFSTLFRITILLSVLGSVFMIVSIPIVELVFFE
jgi:O-antigen/teichoic acid export membrane protein